MAWEKFENIRGPKGDKGDPGTIASVSASTLPPGSAARATISGTEDVHVHWDIPRGDKGERGPAGAVASASAESVAADESAAAVMSGTDDVKHLHLKIPRGLPGAEGVPAAEAVGAYLSISDSPARPGFDAGVSQLLLEDDSEASVAFEARVDAGFGARFEQANPLSDPASTLAAVEVVASFKFRHSSNPGWVQGFAVNLDDGHIYVNRHENGASSFTIEVRDMDGKLVEAKTFTTDDEVFIESMNYWRNDAGDLCFLTRRSSAASYAIANFTQGTLGPSVTVLGGYSAWAVDGNSAYTATAWQGTMEGQQTTFLTAIHEYDYESIKVGSPVLVRTFSASPRGALPAKMQGWQAVNGRLVFVGNDSAGITGPTFMAFGYDGIHARTVTLGRREFARTVNEFAPGTVLNVDNYTYEAEGACAVNGALLSGHITGNGVPYEETFTIVRHGSLVSAKVASTSPRLRVDLPETVLSSSELKVTIRTVNGYVNLWIEGGLYIDGIYSGLAAGEEKTYFPAGFIPDWLRPNRVVKWMVPIGNGNSGGVLSVLPSGAITLKNSGTAVAGNINSVTVDYPPR